MKGDNAASSPSLHRKMCVHITPPRQNQHGCTGTDRAELRLICQLEGVKEIRHVARLKGKGFSSSLRCFAPAAEALPPSPASVAHCNLSGISSPKLCTMLRLTKAAGTTESRHYSLKQTPSQ